MAQSRWWGAARIVETPGVASLARPGGNVTSVFVFGSELGPKRLQLLREFR